MTNHALTEEQKLSIILVKGLLLQMVDNFREQSERLLSVCDFEGSEEFLTAIDDINDIIDMLSLKGVQNDKLRDTDEK
jgi:hypothetical protein